MIFNIFCGVTLYNSWHGFDEEKALKLLAHLDEENKNNVLGNLKELGVIIIMTVHKSELRSFGNQVWDIANNGEFSVS